MPRARRSPILPFPGFPGLWSEAQTSHGWAVLRSVSRTSDGFLIGQATFYTRRGGRLLESHSIFLGVAYETRAERAERLL
jgi:hypothetical protein